MKGLNLSGFIGPPSEHTKGNAIFYCTRDTQAHYARVAIQVHAYNRQLLYGNQTGWDLG